MKRFRTISTAYITFIAIIFGCNVYYLVSLYCSIRDTVERDVRSALADADLDELWLRAERMRDETRRKIETGEQTEFRKGETSVAQDSTGNMVSVTQYPDGTTATESIETEEDKSFTNKFIYTVGRQFHAVMDEYTQTDLEMLDSVITKRLADRYIYPDYVASEIIDGQGNVIKSGHGMAKGPHDVFICNYTAEKAYRVYMTPLTRHIISEMAGVIVTVFLLMVVFTLAFIYLFRTVSRLRTLEEMKDDFVNNMTHELKTPIAIAYSANDALLNYDTSNDPEKKESYLRIANRQLRRLGELVESILAMSMERRKTMMLKPEPIEMRPFIGELAAAQMTRIGKEIEIDTDGVADITVEADRTHLSNVINNLIDNAIKYSGDSVRIVIRTDEEGISVADNGIGIPAKALPFLFNKFYRVPHGDRQDVRGYGIGLYYVRSILDKMGWSIRVKSKEGEGSIFTIKFQSDEQQDSVCGG